MAGTWKVDDLVDGIPITKFREWQEFFALPPRGDGAAEERFMRLLVFLGGKNAGAALDIFKRTGP